MSDRPDDMEPILAGLEQRVALAIDRIGELVAENGRLREQCARTNGEAGSPGAAGHADIQELESRIAELDRERLELLADRRALTQRVEDILARLEFLESESVTS